MVLLIVSMVNSMSNILNTQFGRAKLNTNGYYQITSRKEGNHGKLLHRLIYEKFYGIELIPQIHIHHIDKNPTNNCILNLEAMYDKNHKSLHHKGKSLSEDTKQKISKSRVGKYGGENNPMYNNVHTMDSRLKSSKKHNSTGIYGVSKIKHKSYKQGYCWEYSVMKNKKITRLFSSTLNGLKQKVLDKELEWIEYDGN